MTDALPKGPTSLFVRVPEQGPLGEMGKMRYVPATATDDLVARVASELALIDEYNPNEVTPKGWTFIQEGYEAAARRVLEAVFADGPANRTELGKDATDAN